MLWTVSLWQSGFVFLHLCSREFVAKRREMIRPWGSFVKTSNFEVPASPAKWTTRFYKNIEHFQSNYVSLELRWEDWLALDSSICQLIFSGFCLSDFVSVLLDHLPLPAGGHGRLRGRLLVCRTSQPGPETHSWREGGPPGSAVCCHRRHLYPTLCHCWSRCGFIYKVERGFSPQ